LFAQTKPAAKLRRPPRLIAFDAVQFLTEPACAPFLGHDPRPFHKWTRVADVLCMAALKVGDPIVLVVNVEADDFSLHAGQGESAPAPEGDKGAGASARIEGVRVAAPGLGLVSIRRFVRSRKIARALFGTRAR
jgi:hypothetical protein